jgi:hypothetical protein
MPNKADEKKNKKRGLKLLALTGGLVLIGGVAFAYWTQGGSGTGSAATGTTVPITVNQTTTVTGLAPGANPVALTGTFSNTNAATVKVTGLTAVVSGVSPATGCSPSDYVIGGTASIGNSGDVPNGTNVGSWSGLTVAFKNDPAVNQNGCKNATITITYTAV